jgi:hypothetical protein
MTAKKIPTSEPGGLLERQVRQGVDDLHRVDRDAGDALDQVDDVPRVSVFSARDVGVVDDGGNTYSDDQ